MFRSLRAILRSQKCITRNGLLHSLNYKSRTAAPPNSGSSATYLQTCQQILRPWKLRIPDLNEFFHNHTNSQPETPMQPLRTYQCYGHARDTPGFPLSTTNPTWFFHLTRSGHLYVCTLNSRHFVYRTSRTICICTLTLSTLLVEHVISSIWINRITTRSRWKFRICTTTNDLTLYIFVTWGWPTVAETCRQPNKIDTKTVVFWRTEPLLIYN